MIFVYMFVFMYLWRFGYRVVKSLDCGASGPGFESR